MGEGLPGAPDGVARRVGIIGAGFIGAVHANAARRCGAHITGIVASTSETTAAAVRSVGADRGYPDAAALIASDDVDVVHICTPNHLHHPLAEAAIRAGKHVVCEKPLAVDVPLAQSLLVDADAAGVVATVPFVYRFYPMVREARARLAADVGAIRLVHGAYLQDWLSTADDDNWRVDASTSGPSRAFADIGSHWCDLAEFVTGDRIVAVFADLVTSIPERADRGPHAHAFATASADGSPTRPVTTEDIAVVMFRTASGVTGTMLVSQISSGHKNQLRLEISGSAGTVHFDQEHPNSLWIGRRTGSETRTSDPTDLDPAAARYALVPPGHPHGYQDCFDAFVADTYRAITAGSAAAVDGLPTFDDGVRAARITAAVLRSAATGTWASIEPSSLDTPSPEVTR